MYAAKIMQTILDNIELDIQELKCLMQAIVRDEQSSLKSVARRNISQMRLRLDALQQWLDECPDVSVPELQKSELPKPTVQETVSVCEETVETEVPTAILAERIRPTATLRSGISLNDSFRFARELFHDDAARMNQVLQQLGEASSLDEAMRIYESEVAVDEDNEAAADFLELLKKYFN